MDTELNPTDEIEKLTENSQSTEDLEMETSASEVKEKNGMNSNSLIGKRRSKEDDLPKELQVMFEPLECKLCHVIVSSTVNAFTHYKGKVHNKKVEQYLKEHNVNANAEPSSKKRKKDYKPSMCETCNVELTSELQALQHMSGKSHLKRKQTNQVKPVKVPEAKPDPTGRFGIGVSFLESGLVKCDQDSFPELGVTNCDQDLPEPQESSLYCKICKISMNSEASYESHLNGVKHLKKSKLENTAHSELLSKYRTPSNNFYCNSCNVFCNSGEQFMAHMTSKKHLKPKN